MSTADKILSIVHAFSDEGRKNSVRKLAKRVEPIEDFVRELADEPCTYGDDCPVHGSNHGRCLHCKAREALRVRD